MVLAKAKDLQGRWTLLLGITMDDIKNHIQGFIDIANQYPNEEGRRSDVLVLESLVQVTDYSELQNIDAHVIYQAGMIALTEALQLRKKSFCFAEVSVGFKPPCKYIK